MKYGFFPALILGVLLAACSEKEQAPVGGADVTPPHEAVATGPAPTLTPSGPPPTKSGTPLPAPFENTQIKPGECMAFVDTVNQNPSAELPVMAVKSALKVVGWNIVAEKQGVTPSSIFAVLEPYDSAQSGAVLAATRTQRPDVAGDNKAYMMAGYEASGEAPASAGRYRVFLVTGTREELFECDTKVDIDFQ